MSKSVSLRDYPDFKTPTSKEVRYISRVLLDKSIEVVIGAIILCTVTTIVLGYGWFNASDTLTLVFYTIIFFVTWLTTMYIVLLTFRLSKLYRSGQFTVLPCHIASVRVKYTGRGTDYLARVKYHNIVFSDIFSVPSHVKLMVHRGEDVRVLVCLCQDVLSLVYY